MPELYEMNDMQPKLYISSQNLPEVDFWMEGEEYEVDVKLKLVEVTKTDGQKTRAEFVIESITPKPPIEVAVMRHSEFKKALSEEKRKIAEDAGELA